ncbi:MAG TPA: hypothetical protein VL096_04570, partial [Pirellulaceae bacterium]|nr:hypothetical protein [Pirellulaceae bacterium]
RQLQAAVRKVRRLLRRVSQLLSSAALKLQALSALRVLPPPVNLVKQAELLSLAPRLRNAPAVVRPVKLPRPPRPAERVRLDVARLPTVWRADLRR